MVQLVMVRGTCPDAFLELKSSVIRNTIRIVSDITMIVGAHRGATIHQVYGVDGVFILLLPLHSFGSHKFMEDELACHSNTPLSDVAWPKHENFHFGATFVILYQ